MVQRECDSSPVVLVNVLERLRKTPPEIIFFGVMIAFRPFIMYPRSLEINLRSSGWVVSTGAATLADLFTFSAYSAQPRLMRTRPRRTRLNLA
jgi:hypothetical protein